MAQEGAIVFIAGHSWVHIDETVESLRAEGLKAVGIFYDGSDVVSVRESVEEAASQFGRIDVLVNNVGGTDMRLDGSIDSLDINYFEAAMTLNLKSTLEATRAALPHMSSGSSIVNVASIGGLTGDFRGTLYGISKAGVVNLTRYTATQCGRLGIRCNAVAPGLILTKAAIDNLQPEVRKIFADQTPLPYFGESEDVGATIAFLASDDAKFISGQTIVVDGGMMCHNPTALTLQNMSHQ